MSAKGACVRRLGRSAEDRSELPPIDQTARQDQHEGDIDPAWTDSARPCSRAA